MPRRTSKRTKGTAGEPWEPSPEQIEIYRKVAVDQQLQRNVANEHGISQSRVSRLVSRVGAWLANKYEQETRDLKRDKLAQLEAIIVAAIDGFNQSKRPAVIRQTKRTKKHGDVVTRTIKPQSGNPAYLQQAIKAIDTQLKIGGGYAPIEVDMNMMGEVRVAGQSFDQVADQFHQRIDLLKEEQKLLEEKTDANPHPAPENEPPE